MAKTLDVSSISNDFIYNMVDFYLDEVMQVKGQNNLVDATVGLVDCIMSYYLMARQNGVVDLEASRKMLSLKLKNSPVISIEGKIDLHSRFSEYEPKLLSHLSSNYEDILIPDDPEALKQIRYQLNRELEPRPEVVVESVNEKINQLELKLRQEIDAMTKAVTGKTQTPAKRPNKPEVSASIKADKPNTNLQIPRRHSASQEQVVPIPRLDLSPIINRRDREDAVAKGTMIYERPKGSTLGSPEDELRAALDRLKSRINTPFVNIILASVVLKAATTLLS